MEETQEEIYTSSERREEEAGGGDLVTLAPEILDLEENVRMDLSRKVECSSGWSGRGSRSRDSSTSMSRRDKREQFDELNCAVAAMVEEVKKEVATVGEDVKKVAKKVDMIEEEVGATKNLLQKTLKSGKGGGSDTGTCQENTANGGGVGNTKCWTGVGRKNDEKEKNNGK